MVKKINVNIFNGIAGSNNNQPKGVIIHNDAGSMTPEQYQGWLQQRYNNGQSASGFAHYYVNRNTILRVENTYSGAWAAANPYYNQYFLHYEVCEQLKVSDSDFIKNEDVVLMQAAEDMHYYGLTPSYDTVALHHDVSQTGTSCPQRSMQLHGGTYPAVREYFIAKLKEFMSLGTTVEEMLAKYDGSNVQVVTQTNETPKTNESASASGQILHLPSSEETWNVYNVDGPYTIAYAIGQLAPARFGGLEYEILGWKLDTVCVIETQTFGKVAIYVGDDTPAEISNSATPPKINWEEWNGTVKVDKLNVRNAPSTNNTPVATYSKGERIYFDGWIVANGYRWGTYISYSGVRRYVAYCNDGTGEKYLNY